VGRKETFNLFQRGGGEGRGGEEVRDRGGGGRACQPIQATNWTLLLGVSESNESWLVGGGGMVVLCDLAPTMHPPF